jgi:hypothetical protein
VNGGFQNLGQVLSGSDKLDSFIMSTRFIDEFKLIQFA